VLLEVRGLNAFYGNLQALFSVNLDVGEGEILAVIGSNGAGKTTLLKSIMNIEVRKEGRVYFDGVDITRLPTHRIARLGVLFIPDNTGLYPGLTVLENFQLAVGRKDVDLGIVREVYPEITGLLGRSADRLSGGERKIVSVLRAFLLNPKLILLDEPTEGVSPIVAERIYSLLKMLSSRGKSLIVVESGSKLKLALKNANRIAVMTAGRITYVGEVDKAQKDLDIIRKLVFA